MRSGLPALHVAAIALLLVAGSSLAGRRPAHADEVLTIPAADDKLHLSVPAWGLTKSRDTDDQLRAWWYGKQGASDVTVEVRTYPRKAFFLDAPEDVTDYTAGVYRLTERKGDSRFAFLSREEVSGTYGWIPRAVVCRAPLPCIQTPRGELLMLAGVLREHAYEITVVAYPRLTDAHRETVLAFFRTGVRAECPVQDPRWTEAEVTARWNQVVLDPDLRKQRAPVVRTEHYLVFTNGPQGKPFAKRMEDCYRKIQRAFPCLETEDRRLMPVYLFKTPEQYYDFHVRATGGIRSTAEATSGFARQDFYATFDASPGHPTRIHEAAHQALRTRSRLRGGGAWLQEGLATYLSTKPAERKAWAKDAARRGPAVTLPVLLARPELPSEAERLQAASLIEFLRDGRWKRKQLPAFLRRAGLAPKNEIEALEQIVRELYGVDLAGLQERWLAYWKKR